MLNQFNQFNQLNQLNQFNQLNQLEELQMLVDQEKSRMWLTLGFIVEVCSSSSAQQQGCRFNSWSCQCGVLKKTHVGKFVVAIVLV